MDYTKTDDGLDLACSPRFAAPALDCFYKEPLRAAAHNQHPEDLLVLGKTTFCLSHF